LASELAYSFVDEAFLGPKEIDDSKKIAIDDVEDEPLDESLVEFHDGTLGSLSG
jgi:hypothetical protein